MNRFCSAALERALLAHRRPFIGGSLTFSLRPHSTSYRRSPLSSSDEESLDLLLRQMLNSGPSPVGAVASRLPDAAADNLERVPGGLLGYMALYPKKYLIRKDASGKNIASLSPVFLAAQKPSKNAKGLLKAISEIVAANSVAHLTGGVLISQLQRQLTDVDKKKMLSVGKSLVHYIKDFPDIFELSACGERVKLVDENTPLLGAAAAGGARTKIAIPVPPPAPERAASTAPSRGPGPSAEPAARMPPAAGALVDILRPVTPFSYFVSFSALLEMESFNTKLWDFARQWNLLDHDGDRATSAPALFAAVLPQLELIPMTILDCRIFSESDDDPTQCFLRLIAEDDLLRCPNAACEKGDDMFANSFDKSLFGHELVQVIAEFYRLRFPVEVQEMLQRDHEALSKMRAFVRDAANEGELRDLLSGFEDNPMPFITLQTMLSACLSEDLRQRLAVSQGGGVATLGPSLFLVFERLSQYFEVDAEDYSVRLRRHALVAALAGGEGQEQPTTSSQEWQSLSICLALGRHNACPLQFDLMTSPVPNALRHVLLLLQHERRPLSVQELHSRLPPHIVEDIFRMLRAPSSTDNCWRDAAEVFVRSHPHHLVLAREYAEGGSASTDEGVEAGGEFLVATPQLLASLSSAAVGQYGSKKWTDDVVARAIFDSLPLPVEESAVLWRLHAKFLLSHYKDVIPGSLISKGGIKFFRSYPELFELFEPIENPHASFVLARRGCPKPTGCHAACHSLRDAVRQVALASVGGAVEAAVLGSLSSRARQMIRDCGGLERVARLLPQWFDVRNDRNEVGRSFITYVGHKQQVLPPSSP